MGDVWDDCLSQKDIIWIGSTADSVCGFVASLKLDHLNTFLAALKAEWKKQSIKHKHHRENKLEKTSYGSMLLMQTQHLLELLSGVKLPGKEDRVWLSLHRNHWDY